MLDLLFCRSCVRLVWSLPGVWMMAQDGWQNRSAMRCAGGHAAVRCCSNARWTAVCSVLLSGKEGCPCPDASRLCHMDPQHGLLVVGKLLIYTGSNFQELCAFSNNFILKKWVTIQLQINGKLWSCHGIPPTL